ncbi:hypothetical protein ACTHPH_21690 [Paenibacillus pasadenensis]|uniref:hypothetical protein n=1 Tax=Paenibacillus pasadenensis TaxID=217090 RepID=UPI0004905218|nr:hypothetical protein [Paenibacillus pasadenensis]
MKPEVYRQLKEWELARSTVMFPKPPIEDSFANLFGDPEEKLSPEEERRQSLHFAFLRMSVKEQELSAQGIDAEYVVTTAYPEYRWMTWFFNYRVIEIKSEFGPYLYRISEGFPDEEGYRKTFSSFEEACQELTELYSYQPSFEADMDKFLAFWRDVPRQPAPETDAYRLFE